MSEQGRLEVTASRIVYENPWIRVREDETLLPDGTPGIYSVIEKSPSALIVAVDDDDRCWMVEQWRHTIGGRHLEFPQGAADADPGLDPETVARAELLEETGLSAGRLEHVRRIYFAYGICDQAVDIWLARDLEHGEAEPEHTEQGLETIVMPRAEVVEQARSGAIVDAASVAAVWLTADLLGPPTR